MLFRSRVPIDKVAHEEEIEKVSMRIEELINGEPLKTFNALFDPYIGNTKRNSLKISFAEIENLFEALNHKMKKPKGGSSHVKVTVNGDKQFQEDAEQTMLVIVKDTYIDAGAIDQISKTFMSYGLYPKYLEEELRKKMLID